MATLSSTGVLSESLFGSYRLEQLIEQHVWGPVFLARDSAGMQFLVRVLKDKDKPSASSLSSATAHLIAVGRFQQEANHIAGLHHPHVLPLLDYGIVDGQPYLVYPAASLISLRALLSRQGTTDLGTVGRYLEQIVDALAYAHKHSILHRNLSTQCIYLQSNRQLVVAEFGLARMVALSRLDGRSEQEQAQMPRSYQSYEGSSESSAPEQLLGTSTGASADIYALGAVLYRLLTGHAPFEGKTRAEVSRQHLYAIVPSLSAWRSDLPAGLNAIVSKAMAKEPEQRYSSPEALLQDYYRIIQLENKQGTVSPRQERPYTFPFQTSEMQVLQGKSGPLTEKLPIRRPSRRRFFAFAGTGAIVATAAIVAGGIRVLSDVQKTGNGLQPTPVRIPLGSVNDLPINRARTFPISQKVHPGVLIHLPDNRFVAFDSTCTHMGCDVAYDPQRHLLVCPCHNAIFDPARQGAVVSGPAPKPLMTIPIQINPDGTIVARE